MSCILILVSYIECRTHHFFISRKGPETLLRPFLCENWQKSRIINCGVVKGVLTSTLNLSESWKKVYITTVERAFPLGGPITFRILSLLRYVVITKKVPLLRWKILRSGFRVSGNRRCMRKNIRPNPILKNENEMDKKCVTFYFSSECLMLF